MVENTHTLKSEAAAAAQRSLDAAEVCVRARVAQGAALPVVEGPAEEGKGGKKRADAEGGVGMAPVLREVAGYALLGMPRELLVEVLGMLGRCGAGGEGGEEEGGEGPAQHAPADCVSDVSSEASDEAVGLGLGLGQPSE
jgi:hypothetical protein